MTFTKAFSGLSLAALLAAGLSAAPAHAMTAKECHAAFKTAKQNGSLNGQSYKAFKAASCGETTKAAAAPAAAAETAPTAAATPTAPATAATPASTAAPVATKAPVASSGNVVFPTAISPEFSKLSAGRARQKTCVAQYNANKVNGGNGALKWIQKGGGYWSQCNSRLKGE